MKPNYFESLETPSCLRAPTEFGCPRDFLGNRFIFIVISSRVRGLEIGINLNPELRCNFDCICCEVPRPTAPVANPLDVDVMIDELQRTIQLVRSGKIRQFPAYRSLDEDLLELRHVALTGDGEPTLSPYFSETSEKVIHFRASGARSNFKLVWLTNGSNLDLPVVQEKLKFFTSEDEIWIKLDAGTQEYMSRVNRGEANLQKVLGNIRLVGAQRPILLQSIFLAIDGEEPATEEIDEYIERLKELKQARTQIESIHVFSAARPSRSTGCSHLPLKCLYRISQRIKDETGFKAEVF